MSEVDISKKTNQLRLLLSAIKTKKPEKPLRKRIAKKYKKLHQHYLNLIEDNNRQTQVMILAFEIILLETATIQELSEVNAENKFLKLNISEREIANLKIYNHFKRITKIMGTALGK